MRLTDRSMLRVADDLRAADRALAATEPRRVWVKERDPEPSAPVQRVQAPVGWLTRIWRVTVSGGHA